MRKCYALRKSVFISCIDTKVFGAESKRARDISCSFTFMLCSSPSGRDIESPMGATYGPLERMGPIRFQNQVTENVDTSGHARADHGHTIRRVGSELELRILWRIRVSCRAFA